MRIEELLKLTKEEIASHAQEGWATAEHWNQKYHEALREAARQKAEVHRLRGPFTCAHDPQFVGGACAACHADWIDRASRYQVALETVIEALDAFFTEIAGVLPPDALAISRQSIEQARKALAKGE